MSGGSHDRVIPERPGLISRSHGRLQGKVALVTGSGAQPAEETAVGHAMAVILAAAGAQVAVVDRDEAAAAFTVGRIRDLGHEAIPLMADVRSSADCEAAAQAAVDTYGRLDIVINNAAILGAADTVEASDDAFLATLDINLMGAVRMSRAALPHLGYGSSITHISSLGSLRSFGKLAYEASKGGLNAMVNTMAIQHGPGGVRVNGVCPGQMWTPMGRRRLVDMGFSRGQIEAHRRERAEGVPIKREGSGWDVAAATLFLASDDACWITGHVLVVDGGQSGVVGYMPRMHAANDTDSEPSSM